MQLPVSDQNLSMSKAHISPSRHNLRSKPSSSKYGRSRRKSTGRCWTTVDLRAYIMNDQSSNSNSPYYKGLTDQSLAIVDSCPTPHNHTHIHTHTTDLLSSGYISPYYKGLTDYSLVIDSWSPENHNHPNPLNYERSPYYRGLTDYSLALHPPPITHPHPSPSIFSINTDFHFKNREDIKTDFKLRELMVDGDSDLIKGKPLRVMSVSEESKAENALEEIADETALEEMEGIHNDVQEKPLRENESEAIQVGSVLEDNEEKIISEEMELVIEGTSDDVEMVIEEKPLRERVLEENSDEIMEFMTDDVGLVIEEKALRERVSETSDVENVEDKTNMDEMNVWKEKELKHYELGGEKEKTLSFSEQTFVSELQRQCGGKVYEYLWATKYQPMFLADFICNRDKALQLKAMVKEGCGCNHFIFEGPPNAGKRSMIRAMLGEIFGANKVQVIEECKDFNLKGEMVDNLQVRVKKSLHHVEVNLSETKGYEKHVIVELFKETYAKMIKNNSLPCTSENCQAIVLYETEKLSMESLFYIKWMLEKHKGCNKVFFCCSDESKLQPVKPLCTTVRLSSPSSEEMVNILEYIGKEEGIKLSRDLVKKIILRSKNNLRQAIRSLEASCRNKDALEDDDLILTGWEEDILNIAKKITEEQSPRQLYVIHRKLQSLVIHDVPPDFVYKHLVADLTNLVHESLRSGVAKVDKEFYRASEIKFETMKKLRHAQNKQEESDENDDSTRKNALTYLKVEEFIAKFMSWYKNSSEKGNKQVQLIAGT